MAKKEKVTEKNEIKRLTSLYQGMPAKQFSLAQGLISQAARLRVQLDRLWTDLEENGVTEWFTQSEKTEPYERERPQARLFISTDKNFQSIMKQLNEMLALAPTDPAQSKLSKFTDD